MFEVNAIVGADDVHYLVVTTKQGIGKPEGNR
jgi:hypothetical protein